MAMNDLGGYGVLRDLLDQMDLKEPWTCPTCREVYTSARAVKRRCCQDTWEHDIRPRLLADAVS